jgi:hypothetical protein
MQKFAWFNLAVIGLAAVVMLSLWPFLGKGALGGSGFLGLLGFSPLFFFRKKPGHVLTDERDALISWRSWIAAYSLFWVVFVLVAVIASAAVFGQDGAVPVWIVQFSVFFFFMLVQAVASLAILIQYGRRTSDAE